MDIAMVTGIVTLIYASHAGDFCFNKQGELRFMKRLVHFLSSSRTQLLYLTLQHYVAIYGYSLEDINHSANLFQNTIPCTTGTLCHVNFF